MKSFIDIIDLFDLESSDLKSRDTIMDKKEEILLLFDLDHESSIVMKDYEMDRNEVIRLFDDIKDNITNYSFVHKKKRLSAFLTNGTLESLDLSEFIALNPKLKEWLKPYFNHAFYTSAIHFIYRKTYINPKEYKQALKKVNSINTKINSVYLDETKQKIDEKWGDLLAETRILFTDNPPRNKSELLKAFKQIKHLSSTRKGKLVYAFTRPFNFGKNAFDYFLQVFLNASLDAVRGNISKYSSGFLMNLRSICLYLKKENPTQKITYNEILNGLVLELSQKDRKAILKAIVKIVVGLFILNFIWNHVITGSIWDTRFPPDRYNVVVDNYNPDSNTVKLTYNYPYLNRRDMSGDQLLEKGWDAFEGYLPDTNQFKIIAKVKYLGGDAVIERRIFMMDSAHQILPTVKDSIYFAQPIAINYEFKENEGLAFGCNYILPQKSIDVQLIDSKVEALQDTIVEENCLITDKKTLFEPAKYLDNNNQRILILGSINDYFFLRDRIFNYGEVQKVPRTQESRYLKPDSNITLEMENGLNPNHFFILARSEKRILANYLINKETKEIVSVSRKKIPSTGRLESSSVQKVLIDELRVQQFLNQ